MAFDIERFMELSRAVETSDLDWDSIAAVGITDDEARILRYMADVESHTMLYMRSMLAGHSARDPEVVGFLSCWVYEETFHGRALDRVLSVCGHAPEQNRYTQIAAAKGLREQFIAFLARAAARMTPHLAATHMVWGAIQEMTAAIAYIALARTTANKEMAKLLLRISKDERRHQTFYYHQAQKRLAASPVARGIASFTMKRFWGPVGSGVGEADVFGFISALHFDNEWGRKEFANIDATISQLPGLEWFNLVSTRIPAAGTEFKNKFPVKAAEIAEMRMAS